jgi:hypothetical protein
VNIANEISILLSGKEFAKNAPKAKIALSAVKRGNYAGIDMLDHLLHSGIPIFLVQRTSILTHSSCLSKLKMACS